MNDDQSDIAELYGFMLENLPKAELARRARLCRALSRIIGRADFARELVAEADACAAIEKRHEQMVLKFNREMLG